MWNLFQRHAIIHKYKYNYSKPALINNDLHSQSLINNDLHSQSLINNDLHSESIMITTITTTTTTYNCDDYIEIDVCMII